LRDGICGEQRSAKAQDKNKPMDFHASFLPEPGKDWYREDERGRLRRAQVKIDLQCRIADLADSRQRLVEG